MVYKIDKGIINGFNNDRKENGEDILGNIFTVTDKEHADNIFRMLAGNSNVEYGKADYEDNKTKRPLSRIWTDMDIDKSGVEPIKEIVRNGSKLLSKTHSHPYKGGHSLESYAFSTGYPSPTDVKNIKEYLTNPKSKNSKYSVYHPYNPNNEEKVMEINYDDKGVIGIDPLGSENETIKNRNSTYRKYYWRKLKEDYEKNIPKEKRDTLKIFYK